MVDKVREWLERLGLAKYAGTFAENEIDFDILQHLEDNDLKELGLPFGPRKKLLLAVAELRGAGLTSLQTRPAARGGERRQLTIMFVDLVGSTHLANTLDPEVTREILRRYQNTVSGVVTRYEGHVAKFMGDGVIAYFGYPAAHEDDAERSVRAGLEIAKVVSDLESASSAQLACRIGIATGPVVVGDLIGEGAAQEEAVTGGTPNLAARLQEVAGPGEVIVSSETRNLLGNLFQTRSMGLVHLKGFEDEVEVWRITSPREIESRFEAVRGAAMTPIVGRERELALLLDRWGLASEGEGQVVLLSGEAGIGKSRLISALFENMSVGDSIRLRYQCSPHHANSPLYPIIAQLNRAADFAEGDSPEVKLGKLEALLGLAVSDVTDVAPLFANLLSIPTGHHYEAITISPPQRMQRTQRALVDQLAGLARNTPVLMFVEDVHWADPTTLEVLGLMLDRIESIRVLAIVTYRPEFQLPWHVRSHATILNLNRLSRRQSMAVVTELVGAAVVPESVLEQIVEKTDGVPLFLEELTKTVLESELVKGDGSRVGAGDPLRTPTIPSTLHDSLIARLDKLGAVKELALTAAAIGREFSHRLLAAVSALPDFELSRAIDQLVTAELIFRRDTPSGAAFVFKHALVRDVAYEVLLRNQRTALHAKILRALEVEMPHLVETEPELLAYHATQAEEYGIAIEYWLRAGRRSAASSANAEAVSQLRQGVALLEHLPENDERLRVELEYLISLGPALMATVGWDAPEVDSVYSRARELARQTTQAAALFPAVWGLWLVAHAGGAVVRAGELLVELLDLARDAEDDDLMLQAHHAGGSEMCSEARFERAQHHIDAGIRLYRIERHADQALQYGGHDPCVCAHCLGALSLLMMGHLSQAERYSLAAIELAGHVAHRPSVAHADLYRAELCHLLDRPIESEERARRVIQIAEPFGLVHYSAWGKMLIGWAQSTNGDPENGLLLLESGFTELKAVGIRYHLAHRLSLRVGALMAADRPSEAVSAAEECLTAAEGTGERWFEPEALRLLALAKARISGVGSQEIRELFVRSLELADVLEARYWGLRTANSFARHLLACGETNMARDLLGARYHWFVEGLDAPTLIEAKALLGALG